MLSFNYKQPRVNKGAGLGSKQFLGAAEESKEGSHTLKELNIKKLAYYFFFIVLIYEIIYYSVLKASCSCMDTECFLFI